MTVSEGINLVLIDDEILIRQPVKILLEALGEKENIHINLYSASNGVEGMGLIYIVNPEVIVIDTTLPRYSGRELIEFLTTNPKFRDRLVFIIHDGNLPLVNIPANYIVLNKKDSRFVQDLSVLLERYVSNKKNQLNNKLNRNDVLLSSKYSKFRNAKFGIRKLLIQQTLIWGNRGDLLMYRISNSFNIILKLLLYPFWILCQFFSSLFLSFLMLVSPKVVDSNIAQGKTDLIKFRVKTYPTLATFFVGLIFVMFQGVVFVGGGMIIFNNRIISIFADVSPTISIDFSNAEYDSSKIEFTGNSLRLNELPTSLRPSEADQPVEETTTIPEDEAVSKPEQIILEEQTIEETPQEAVDEVVPNETPITEDGSVQGVSTENNPEQNGSSKKYSLENPYIVFNQKIPFDKLINIYEESSLNPSKEGSFSNNPLTPEAFVNRILPSNTIAYQLSPDKQNWFYYGSENKWEKTTNSFSSSNTVQEVNQFLNKYITDVGGGDLYIKIFLHSDGNTQIELRSLSVEREVSRVSSLTPINTAPENQPIEETDLLLIPSYPANSQTPVSFPEEDNQDGNLLVDLPIPTIFNASFVNGNKIIGGKILNTNISDADLDKFKVKIYYTSNTNIAQEASTKGAFIGEANLEKNSRGEIIFFLQTPGTSGGFIVAELVYSPLEGLEFISELSKPVES